VGEQLGRALISGLRPMRTGPQRAGLALPGWAHLVLPRHEGRILGW